MSKRGRRVRIGWFEGVTQAIAGAIVGALLFVGAIALLWINEGRVNLASLARRSVVVDPSRVDSANDRALVSVTDRANGRAPLGDGLLLRDGPYVALQRRVEMYAWVERCDQRERCHYATQWTEAPRASREFRAPAGHHNPPMRVRPAAVAVDATVGAYAVRTGEAAARGDQRLSLRRDMLRDDAPFAMTITGDQRVYIGDRTVDQPAVGDLRVTFDALASGALVTVFGAQEGAKVEPYAGEARLYRMLRGDRATAIRTLATEHRVIGWLLRIVGTLLVWVSMNLWLGPLCAMFDIFPPLGRASRSIVASATLPIALALSVTVALVSMIAHSVALLVLALSLLALLALTQRDRGR
jgi:hypothetical protein